MRKLFIFVATLLLALGCLNITSFADDGLIIVESSDLKIVINGEKSDYTDTPLLVNNRTMLPLREVLVNLGVQNDDEHIIWNGEDQSVTIVAEDTTVVLFIGSTTAYVNEEEVVLDVAPILYEKNWRSYIPARFVSEALGKKVAWDGIYRTVLISSNESFNEVYDILLKSGEAMADIKKMKFIMDLDMDMSSSTENAAVTMDFDGEMDLPNDKSHLNMTMDMTTTGTEMSFPISMAMEYYEENDIAYANVNMFGMDTGWTKSDVEDETVYVEADMFGSFGANEVMASGLVVAESDDEGTIVLQGSAIMQALINQSIISSMTETEEGATMAVDDFLLEMGIDKTTYEVKYFNFDMTAALTDTDGTTLTMEMSESMTLSDLNGDFEIVIPQEVIDEAEAAAEAEQPQ
ncbi:Copper amine oxidase N-terminal domain-containing protein [Dethiosulfatibacter aminovorans DSM 17477]|uniref:Copper amine oxidase N-terminal domain-containing protein n=1 Tax=Dethiosulfatibacter aminovorans DSM 17477 TaxID=1121476 RepID=A0A1M6I4A5_9FIRM|nr:copper amine oxidase N-terminal domain-containing protein [Dethiosulfatibacter aminovorans]SHJ29200.1 Copper amine oxidase N-terminal domain-containing protein [Dethiosulfatibacter aminovorans DSM 17477]